MMKKYFLVLIICAFGIAVPIKAENIVNPGAVIKPWAFMVEIGSGNLLNIMFMRNNLIKSLDIGVAAGCDFSSVTVDEQKYSTMLLSSSLVVSRKIWERNNKMISGRVQIGYNYLKVDGINTGAVDFTPSILAGYHDFYATVSGVILLTQDVAFVPQIGMGYRVQF